MRYSQMSKKCSTAHNTASLPSHQNTKQMVQRDSNKPYTCFITQCVEPQIKPHLLFSSVSPPAVCASETSPSAISTTFSNDGMETFPSYMTPEKVIEKDCKTMKRRCIEQFMSPFAFAKYVADQLPAGCYELPKLQHSLSKGEYRVRFILDGKRRERSFSTKVRGNAYAQNAASLLVRLIQLRCKNEKKDGIYEKATFSNHLKPAVVDTVDFSKSPNFIPENSTQPQHNVVVSGATFDNPDPVTRPTLQKCEAFQENDSFKEIVIDQNNNFRDTKKQTFNSALTATKDCLSSLPYATEAFVFNTTENQDITESYLVNKEMKSETKRCALSPQTKQTHQIATIVDDKIPATCKPMFRGDSNEQLHTSSFFSVNVCHDKLKYLNDTSHTRNFFSSNQPQVTNTDTGISKELHELFLKYHEKIKTMVRSFNKSISSTFNTFWENEFIHECCYELLQVLLTLDKHKKKLQVNSSTAIETQTYTAVKNSIPNSVFQSEFYTGDSPTSALNEYNPFRKIACVSTPSSNVSFPHQMLSTPIRKNLTPEQANILEQVSINALGPTRKKKMCSNRRPSITFQSEGPSWTIFTPYYDYYSRRTSTCQYIVPLTDLSADTVSETFMSSLMYLLQTFKYSNITAQCLNKSGEKQDKQQNEWVYIHIIVSVCFQMLFYFQVCVEHATQKTNCTNVECRVHIKFMETLKSIRTFYQACRCSALVFNRTQAQFY